MTTLITPRTLNLKDRLSFASQGAQREATVMTSVAEEMALLCVAGAADTTPNSDVDEREGRRTRTLHDSGRLFPHSLKPSHGASCFA